MSDRPAGGRPLRSAARPAEDGSMDVPSPRQHLEQLSPPAPVLDTATLLAGLGDAAARESVARLLTGYRGP